MDFLGYIHRPVTADPCDCRAVTGQLIDTNRFQQSHFHFSSIALGINGVNYCYVGLQASCRRPRLNTSRDSSVSGPDRDFIELSDELNVPRT